MHWNLQQNHLEQVIIAGRLKTKQDSLDGCIQILTKCQESKSVEKSALPFSSVFDVLKRQSDRLVFLYYGQIMQFFFLPFAKTGR